MKAVGYIRVSTEEQAKNGISLDAQRAKIEAYATLEEMELIGIVEDAGLSGCSVKHRPGLQRVLGMIREKEADAVIVFKLDRLARNTMATLEIAKLMDRKAAALHSITERLDTKSALGRFFFTLMASLAEMERGILSERIRAAMERKRQTGEPRNGNPPYGQRIHDGLLVPDRHEQAIIERICCLREGGYTVHEIVAILTDEGVRNRKGREFGKSQVHTILQRHAA